MKRIFIALAFIIASICIASAEMGYVSAKVDMFDAKIAKADKLMYRGEFDEALSECEKIENDWDDSTKIMDVLLIHDYVDSIGIRLSQMKSFAKTENSYMYFAESSAAKKELASIKESEYPMIDNLL